MLLVLAAPLTARAEDPLCGIHCVYTAALLLDLKPTFADLLKPEFVGSDEGSSLAELERAAGTLGLQSLAVTKLTTNDLRWSKWPVVLHVKTDIASNRFNHFVLLGGFREGKAIIYDGTRHVQMWTLAEIACRWDGNALVLSKEPVALSDLTAPSRLSMASWALALLGAVGIGLLCQNRAAAPARGLVRASRNQAMVLLAVAGCGALIFHATSADGFIAGPQAVRDVRAANASTFLPKIDFATAQRLLDAREAVFVDARSAKEFNEGHIPGAVNISALASEADATRIAATLPAERTAVVYCGNPACPFSLATAQKLLRAGRTDVVIYSGGWKDWQSRVGAENRS